MSGIEIIGLAASILQIADLGWRSSYKLYAFSKKVHDASKAIELVSQDIAATGAILKQLGEAVKKDEETTPASRLSTQGLVAAASKLVDECQALFREIDQGITGADEGSKVILGFKQRLKWSYLEPRVDLLRTNLERLKSSLALMLNVLIYAEQQRSRQGAAVLKEQQELVASLAEQKTDSEKRIEELNKRIEAPGPLASLEETMLSTPTPTPSDILAPSDVRSVTDSRIQPPGAAMSVAGPMASFSHNLSAVQIPPFHLPDKSAPAAKTWMQPLSVRARATIPNQSARRESPADLSHPPELDHHRLLIESLLGEVNSSKYALDHGLRYRLHDGVLELHWREWQPLRKTYGDEMLQAILSQSPVLARHWYEMATKLPPLLDPPKVAPKEAPYPRKSRTEKLERDTSHHHRSSFGDFMTTEASSKPLVSENATTTPQEVIDEQMISSEGSEQPRPVDSSASAALRGFQSESCLDFGADGDFYNLDFSTLGETSEPLEHFDFDAFLKSELSTTEDKFDFNIPSQKTPMENIWAFESAASHAVNYRIAAEPTPESNAGPTRANRKDDEVDTHPRPPGLEPERQQTNATGDRNSSGNDGNQVNVHGDRALEAQAQARAQAQAQTAVPDALEVSKRRNERDASPAQSRDPRPPFLGEPMRTIKGPREYRPKKTKTNRAGMRDEPKRTTKRGDLFAGGARATEEATNPNPNPKVRFTPTVSSATSLEEEVAGPTWDCTNTNPEPKVAFASASAASFGEEVTDRHWDWKRKHSEDERSLGDAAASIADQFLREWTTVEPLAGINTERTKRIYQKKVRISGEALMIDR